MKLWLLSAAIVVVVSGLMAAIAWFAITDTYAFDWALAVVLAVFLATVLTIAVHSILKG